MLCVNDTDCNGNGQCVDADAVAGTMKCECDYGWFEEVNCELNQYSMLEGTYYFAWLHILLLTIIFMFYTHEIIGNIFGKNVRSKSTVLTPLHYAKWGALLFSATRIFDECTRIYFTYIGYTPKTFHIFTRFTFYLGYLFAVSADCCIFLVWVEVAQKVRKVSNTFKKTLNIIKTICWISFAITAVLLFTLTVWIAIDTKSTIAPFLAAFVLGLYTVAIAIAGITYSRKVSDVMKKRGVISRQSQKFLYKNVMFICVQVGFIMYIVTALVYNILQIIFPRTSENQRRLIWVGHIPIIVVSVAIYIFVYFMVEQRSPIRKFLYKEVLTWLGVVEIDSMDSHSHSTTTPRHTEDSRDELHRPISTADTSGFCSSKKMSQSENSNESDGGGWGTSGTSAPGGAHQRRGSHVTGRVEADDGRPRAHSDISRRRGKHQHQRGPSNRIGGVGGRSRNRSHSAQRRGGHSRVGSVSVNGSVDLNEDSSGRKQGGSAPAVSFGDSFGDGGESEVLGSSEESTGRGSSPSRSESGRQESYTSPESVSASNSG